MDEQRFVVKGVTYGGNDPGLQHALDLVYETPERPRCVCVRGGIEMYVAKHRHYVVKRMPNTGQSHYPRCPSYEPEIGQSGLGELIGEAIIERSPDSIELRVDFSLSRIPGRTRVRHVTPEPAEINAPRHRMSLRAVMHFLFERAGFNRWYPAMEGKRTQAVLHKHLLEAADGIQTKGVALERLYVPEQFHEEQKSEIAERRRRKLAVLESLEDECQFKMALALGEYKGEQASPSGRKVWLKHMPDALINRCKGLAADRACLRQRARGARSRHETKQQVVVCALIYAKREHTYQIDTVSFMLTTDNWIPIDGIDEVDLIQALTERRRRFIKPLRYDARSVALFPNALLLDTGAKPTPLHVVSSLMDPNDRAAKERALNGQGVSAWVWRTDKPMPPLPDAVPLKS